MLDNHILIDSLFDFLMKIW